MEKLEVNVRMYAVGELGDCFYLQFKNESEHSSVLIDCGSFRNGAESVKRLQAIVLDIKKQQTPSGSDAKPKAIDVVIGTHQHNDHLSGFTHSATIFEEIGIANVWLSWLDDPTNEKATLISGGQRKLTKQLHDINLKLSGIDSLKSTLAAQRIDEILGFSGLDKEQKKQSPVVPQEGLNFLKRAGLNPARYLSPGSIIDLPGLSAGTVKVYVLGPPSDNDLLFDINPGKGETYDAKLASVYGMAEGLYSAVSNYCEDGPLSDEPFFPFDKKFELPIDGKKSEFLNKSYLIKENTWRKIDEDWLDQAERIALYLDTYTNNSSLVLAFELVESKKVLLFVGDAQTGNWLSWKTVKWDAPNISLDSLLKRTVLYKVGHHCSHNATLPEYLERMTDAELVAMIPVDVSDPNIKKAKGWKMPAVNLYEQIKKMSNSKILRMDDVYEKDCDPSIKAVKDKWGKLHDNIKKDALGVSYKIEG